MILFISTFTKCTTKCKSKTVFTEKFRSIENVLQLQTGWRLGEIFSLFSAIVLNWSQVTHYQIGNVLGVHMFSSQLLLVQTWSCDIKICFSLVVDGNFILPTLQRTTLDSLKGAEILNI